MNRTRRKFLADLAGGAALISFGARTPAFLSQVASAATDAKTETILVILQLTGGNDGLNTVVPFANEDYYKLRPKLAIPSADVLKINDETGLHPSAKGLADLLEHGDLAIVHGVGYPDPNRSHFESMDVWHTCRRKGSPRTTGWLGRYLDAANEAPGADVAAVHVGSEKQPLALAASKVRVPSLASPESFRLEVGGNDDLDAAIRGLGEQRLAPTDPLLSFVQSSTSSAMSASKRIKDALSSSDSPVKYPNSQLAAQLKTVAQMIDAELAARIYYVELDGFDTHSQQAAAHAVLLQQFGDAVHAFIEDVAQRGHGRRTLVASFSEFGRRVAENASAGTDHGAAAPMFLAGRSVRAGLIGDQPSLSDLDNGDLKFQIDFRRVYATLIERWLGGRSSSILAGEFDAIDGLLKSI